MPESLATEAGQRKAEVAAQGRQANDAARRKSRFPAGCGNCPEPQATIARQRKAGSRSTTINRGAPFPSDVGSSFIENAIFFL
ncbi:hypothetical protein [Bacillus sp. 2205SS5-2]|uniref:hypothetical protein n=1 Tax=Bacillus sp. 2205SS5-2 TaxID=3109031 RepID=UPI0030054526